MSRNLLVVVIAVLVVGVAFLGYQYYLDQQKDGGAIDIGKSGVTIEKN
jgi:hypothetical protein